MMCKKNIKLISSDAANAEVFASHEVIVSMFVYPQSKQEHLSIIEDQTSAHLSIIEDSSKRLIGHIILCGVNEDSIEFKRIVVYSLATGYGSCALRLFKNYVSSHFPSCKALWLDVFYHNKIVIKFYESNGFEFIKREDDLLFYECSLNNSRTS